MSRVMAETGKSDKNKICCTSKSEISILVAWSPGVTRSFILQHQQICDIILAWDIQQGCYALFNPKV